MIGIRIGARREALAEGDVTGRLRDCHQRIRAFLEEAAAISAEGELDRERRAVSAAAVERYFRVALPLHEADEDASIAPRLLDGAGIVVALVAEHSELDRRIDRLLGDWSVWAHGGEVDDLGAHRARLAEVRAMMEAHLAREEAQVFPRIDALPHEERLAIVEEIDARRR